MRTLRTRLAATGLAALVVATLAAAAGAATANPVATAVKRQDTIIKSSAQLTALSSFQASTPAQVKKLIPKFAALESKLAGAAAAVARVHPTSASQTAGQKDWVSGVRLIAKAFGQFEIALRDVVKSDKSAARTELMAAEKTAIAGEKLGEKGNALLGLPKTA